MDGLADFSVHWNPVSQRWELQIDYHGFLFSKQVESQNVVPSTDIGRKR
ncbi:MAG TPA: hypothetical protein VNY05_27100 [Candidatus Acidoferrales bacterium]|nr:hypothetical protein [Candidatus Acidoferrales bacterium]